MTTERVVENCCVCAAAGVNGPDSPEDLEAGPGEGMVWLHWISGGDVACGSCIKEMLDAARK